MVKDKDKELSLFLEMRKREKEQTNLLHYNTEEFEAPLGSKPGISPIFNISSTVTPARKMGADDFLNSDNDKNEYDWLITPRTPLFPSLEMESQKIVMSQIDTPKLADPRPEPAVRINLVSRQPASSPGLYTSSTGVRRPSSSGGPGSRPVTPTGRSTLTIVSKPSRSSTPTSQPTLSSTKPTLSSTRHTVSTTKPTLSTSKPSISAAKPTVPSRSSTPSRSTAGFSTPTARPSIPSLKAYIKGSNTNSSTIHAIGCIQYIFCAC